MNANDRGQNLAEARHFTASRKTQRERDWDLGITASRVPLSKLTPVHGGHPDPRCACAGTGWIVGEGHTVVPCAAHPLPFGGDAALPGREPDAVDWEGVAGRALADLQAAANELKRLRAEMPADALREYDRRHHPDA